MAGQPNLDAYFKALPVEIYPVSPVHKVIHVHVPKTAGTSIRLALFGSRVIKHVRAHEIDPKLWVSLPSFAVVRHPLSRFVSNYRFHCKSDYAGVMMRAHPDLKWLTIEDYCDRFLISHPLLAPQTDFLCHPESEKKQVDHLVRFENLTTEVNALFGKLGIKKSIPHVKKSPSFKDEIPQSVREQVEAFYAKDYELFGYERSKQPGPDALVPKPGLSADLT